jgi:uncharacterized delta-60 repeat protein
MWSRRTSTGVVFLVAILALLLSATAAWAVPGDPLWVARYDGGQNDDAHSLALDGKGNVVVVGSSEQSWVDGFMIVKYSPSGAELWSRRYSVGGGGDIATHVAIDKKNAIYVTGNSWQYNRWKDDYLTLKYNAAGKLLWARRYNGTANGNDVPAGIAIDPSGNVVVTGTSAGVRPGALDWDADFATIKYSPSGAVKWTKRLGGFTGGNEGAKGLAIDKSGNVFVTGFSDSAAGDSDYLTAKYGSSGALRWAKRYDGAARGYDVPAAIGVDSVGNAYVTGKVPENANAYPPTDIVTIKYSPSGNEEWVVAAGLPEKSDEATDLTVDRSSNILVCGSSSPGASTDFFLVKYNPAGAEAWNLSVDSDPDRAYADIAMALAADSAGNAYVTGHTDMNDINDYATIRVNADGSLAWAQTYGGPGNDADWSFDIAVNASGAYVTGRSSGGATWRDFATVKFSP